jgi:hypothetical protein
MTQDDSNERRCNVELMVKSSDKPERRQYKDHSLYTDENERLATVRVFDDGSREFTFNSCKDFKVEEVEAVLRVGRGLTA